MGSHRRLADDAATATRWQGAAECRARGGCVSSLAHWGGGGGGGGADVKAFPVTARGCQNFAGQGGGR